MGIAKFMNSFFLNYQIEFAIFIIQRNVESDQNQFYIFKQILERTEEWKKLEIKLEIPRMGMGVIQ